MLWDKEAVLSLIEAYSKRKTEKGSANLKIDDWKEMAEVISSSAKQFSAQQVRVKWQQLLKDFEAVDRMANKLGAGLNPLTECVILPGEHWNDVIEKDPSMEEFKNKEFEFYKPMEKALGRNIPAGRSTLASGEDPSSILSLDADEKSVKHKGDFSTPPPKRSRNKGCRLKVIDSLESTMKEFMDHPPALKKTFDRLIKLDLVPYRSKTSLVIGVNPALAESVMLLEDEEFKETITATIPILFERILGR